MVACDGGRSIPTSDAAAQASECSGHGKCTRQPERCTSRDCSAVCVCEKGFFGTQCGTNELQLRGEQKIRSFQLEAVDSTLAKPKMTTTVSAKGSLKKSRSLQANDGKGSASQQPTTQLLSCAELSNALGTYKAIVDGQLELLTPGEGACT